MTRKKKSLPRPDVDSIEKRKTALKRKHKLVICLNDSELGAVKEYCDHFGVKSMSKIFREATMERILSQLDDCHPTLF